MYKYPLPHQNHPRKRFTCHPESISHCQNTAGQWIDYRKRLKLVKSREIRLVVRKSLKNLTAQIVEYSEKGDKILFSASTNELVKKFNLNIPRSNIPSAYLLGMLIGKKAVKKGIKKVILDIGLYRSVKGAKIFAVLKGAVDSGLNIPHNKEILPSEDRIAGKHIADYIKNNKQIKPYKINVAELGKHLNDVKGKIMKL